MASGDKNFAMPFQVPPAQNAVHRAGFGKYDGPESTLTVEVGRRQCADEQWWCGWGWMEGLTTPASRSAVALV